MEDHYEVSANPVPHQVHPAERPDTQPHKWV
jgi:hypothetical protein